MIRDVGANAVTQGARLGLGISAPRLLMNGEIDDLGDGFGEDVLPFRVERGELVADPAGDPKHKPADARGAGKRPDSELVQVYVVVQTVVRNQQQVALRGAGAGESVGQRRVT